MLFTENEFATAQKGRSKKQLTCIKCGLYKSCNSPKLEPYLKKEYNRVMILFNFPNKEDDKKGSYGTNLNRIELKTILGECGYAYDECVTTSATRCYSKDNPTNLQIDTCRQYIMGYIKKYQPKLIIAVGKHALFSLIGDRWHEDPGVIDKWRGYVIPDQFLGTYIAPVYDLDEIPEKDLDRASVIFRQDVTYALDVFVNQKFPVFVEPKITVLKPNNLKALDKITAKYAAFDYETTGLKPHKEGHKIICASIAVSWNEVFVFVLPEDKESLAPFIRFLQNKRIGKIAQNMKFEESWSFNILKTRVKNWIWDTMLCTHVEDNRSGVTGLKIQTYLRFGVMGYDRDVKKYIVSIEDKNGNSFNRMLDMLKAEKLKEILLKYCAWDSIFEYRMAVIQFDEFGIDVETL